MRAVPVALHYRGGLYRIENGSWRGPDGHVVHLLTWITDDLERSGPEPRGGDPDFEAAVAVADRLGHEASVVVEAP